MPEQLVVQGDGSPELVQHERERHVGHHEPGDDEREHVVEHLHFRVLQEVVPHVLPNDPGRHREDGAGEEGDVVAGVEAVPQGAQGVGQEDFEARGTFVDDEAEPDVGALVPGLDGVLQAGGELELGYVHVGDFVPFRVVVGVLAVVAQAGVVADGVRHYPGEVVLEPYQVGAHGQIVELVTEVGGFEEVLVLDASYWEVRVQEDEHKAAGQGDEYLFEDCFGGIQIGWLVRPFNELEVVFVIHSGASQYRRKLEHVAVVLQGSRHFRQGESFLGLSHIGFTFRRPIVNTKSQTGDLLS